MVFGHRKCFGVHRVVIGSSEGVPNTPGKCMGLMVQRRGEGKGGAPPPLVQFGLPMGGRAPPPCGLPSLSPYGPCGPLLSPGGSSNPPGTPIITRYTPEHFRCLNTIVLYINLYLSTISRLLVMSVISSGTPNKLRSSNHITHIIQNRHRTLSVRTLRVRELCRHDRDTSLVNNQ